MDHDLGGDLRNSGGDGILVGQIGDPMHDMRFYAGLHEQRKVLAAEPTFDRLLPFQYPGDEEGQVPGDGSTEAGGAPVESQAVSMQHRTPLSLASRSNFSDPSPSKPGIKKVPAINKIL